MCSTPAAAAGGGQSFAGTPSVVHSGASTVADPSRAASAASMVPTSRRVKAIASAGARRPIPTVAKTVGAVARTNLGRGAVSASAVNGTPEPDTVMPPEEGRLTFRGSRASPVSIIRLWPEGAEGTPRRTRICVGCLDVDRGEPARTEESHQLRGIPPVGLDALPGPSRGQRRRSPRR